MQFFQCIPEFDFTEQELTANAKMRFLGVLKLNGYEVGKGYGANKKQAKNVAACFAL